MPTQSISFANSTVSIAYDGAKPTRIAEFLFRDVPTSDETPHYRFTLTNASDDADEILLYGEDVLLHRSRSLDEMAVYLLDRTCYHLADRSQGGCLFHGAGVSWQNQGIILAGQTGVGKSTLTAWLLTQGFGYLTDELVFVPQQSNTFQGFIRPINLKPSAKPILDEILNGSEPHDQILEGTVGRLVAASALNRGKLHIKSRLNLIIFPHYKPHSDFDLHRISKAEAGLVLMQCLVNARNLPEHGFPEIVRLVREIPTYQMTYSDFGPVKQALMPLLTQM